MCRKTGQLFQKTAVDNVDKVDNDLNMYREKEKCPRLAVHKPVNNVNKRCEQEGRMKQCSQQ
ncbi:hypothetical protein XYCOK13_02050 [Xylanibacillus composti]|uniref:Uncharacterized protein n=1 Tax=Xylanibacillus composti TaxID=1572762 RepID=A0A8J4H0K5_9BACL|nr:hypothetical protein XYCOK13_02050 [Xylanibacillus composti]